MINACSALRRTTKNNTAFSTLSSLSTQPIKHCLHWKTNGRWERGRWGEREDVVWLGQLGSLEGHSCVLQLLCWTIFSADHLIWSKGGDGERRQREKDSRCTTAIEALQKSAHGQRWRVLPVTFIVTVNNSGRHPWIAETLHLCRAGPPHVVLFYSWQWRIFFPAITVWLNKKHWLMALRISINAAIVHPRVFTVLIIHKLVLHQDLNMDIKWRPNNFLMIQKWTKMSMLGSAWFG